MRAALRASLQAEARSRQTLLHSRLDILKKNAAALTTSPGVRAYALGTDRSAGSERQAAAVLASFQEAHWNTLHHVFLTDDAGRVILSPFHGVPENTHTGQNLGGEPFWAAARTAAGYTGFFGFTERDHFHQLLFFPVQSEGATRSVLVFEIEISETQRVLLEGFEPGTHGRIFLATSDGRLVVRDRKDERVDFKHTGVAAAIGGGTVFGDYVDENGVAVLGAYLRGDFPWILGVEVPRREVYQPLLLRRVVVAGLGLLLSVVLGWFIVLAARRLTLPVQRMTERFRDLAGGEGNLNIRVETTGEAELVQLAELINRFIEKIAAIIRQIYSTTDTAVASAEMLADYSTSFDQVSTAISASVNQSSAALEELSASLDFVSNTVGAQNEAMQHGDRSIAEFSEGLVVINQTARELAGMADHSVTLAAEGRLSVASVTEVMDSIRTLGSEIGDIITIITDISDRTNLLSLNASIEAARAGEHGRGFAVVAGEISKLADTTLRSVRDIKEKIQKTDQSLSRGAAEIDRAAENMQKMSGGITGMNGLVLGIATAVEAQSHQMRVIREMFTRLTGSSSEITNNVREQQSAAGEINQNMADIAMRTESLSETARELATVAVRLQGLGTNLKRQVESFRV